MSSSSPMGTYIYCIAHAEAFANECAPFHAEAIGGSGHPLRILRFGDLAAIVSDVPARRLNVKREYLMAHEAVIQEAMDQSDVIPLSFGTIAKNDEEVVEKLLQRSFDALRDQLEAVKGCVELDLKVLWNQGRLFQEIVAENDRIRALRGALATAPVNEQIELGQLTSELIDSKSEQEAQEVLDELEPLTVEVKTNRPLTDMMALNAAFLVEKTRLEEFDKRVNDLAATEEGRLTFRYAGPVPPYHFVDLSVSWEGNADGVVE
ncbi:MAG TPA: GvpL/GvpF family gas vesicle protein [Ktedonobacterales bacterium]|nr:GvpL/GvpF family gas vesicle protein [Ktedonobacterales bacterium]